MFLSAPRPMPQAVAASKCMVMTGCGFSAAVLEKPPWWEQLPPEEQALWMEKFKMVSSWGGLVKGLAKQLNFEIFRDPAFRWLPGLNYMLWDVIGQVPPLSACSMLALTPSHEARACSLCPNASGSRACSRRCKVSPGAYTSDEDPQLKPLAMLALSSESGINVHSVLPVQGLLPPAVAAAFPLAPTSHSTNQRFSKDEQEKYLKILESTLPPEGRPWIAWFSKFYELRDGQTYGEPDDGTLRR